MLSDLHDALGNIDIYLFDQIMRGRFAPGIRLLDAGCGDGRNLVWFLRNGYDVHGIDRSHEAVARVRLLAARLAPQLPATNFRIESVESISEPDESFDGVVSSAVLHFARDEEEWWRMMREMWRVLAPGGIFFARLASSVGIEEKIVPLGGRRYHLPDGSDRFLVDERMILEANQTLGAEPLDPFKTVVVQSMRSMSTWCVIKGKP
jgi:tellurite methyltransferase